MIVLYLNMDWSYKISNMHSHQIQSLLKTLIPKDTHYHWF